MRQILIRILICGFFLQLAPLVSAKPPTDIKLEYNKTSQMLHIEMRHVTSNNRDHYIRRVIITKNSEKPIVLWEVSQPSPSQFIKDVPMVAKVGDSIRVEAICSNVGRGQATLKIK